MRELLGAVSLVWVCVAGSACERDNGPRGAAAHAKASEPTAPAASRPQLVEREQPAPAVAAGPVGCFGERQVTPVDQWLRVGALGDLDGDGKLDVVIDYDVQQSGGEFVAYVAVFLGDGDGGFRQAHAVAVGPMSYSVALADLDEDGHLDVLVPSVKEARLIVLRGNGDGTLAAPRAVRTGPRPSQVVTADFDGDRHADVLLTLEREVQVLLGDGKGGLRALPVVKAEDAPEPPAVADLDGDGILDLLMVHNDSMSLVALRGRGDGTFEQVARFEDVCDGPYSIVSTNFEGTGVADAAFTCVRSDALWLVRNRGNGVDYSLSSLAIDAYQGLAYGDLTGDRIGDFIAVGQRPGRPIQSNMTLIEGDDHYRFSVRSRAVVDGHIGDPLLGDVNGDGRLDLVASAWHGRRPGHIAVWFGAACE